VIGASLHQTPADPAGQALSHRPIDYWGRNLLDHALGLLPEALADDGTAYLVQLSIIGQRRTAELLQSLGLEARVVDFSFLEAGDPDSSMREQMARVEAHSDAYHLSFGATDVLVAYLLEITRKRKR
jgi:hypothetical protein